MDYTSKYVGDNGATSKVHAMPTDSIDGKIAICGRKVQWINANAHEYDHEVTCLSCVKIMEREQVKANTDKFIAESDARLAAAGCDLPGGPMMTVIPGKLQDAVYLLNTRPESCWANLTDHGFYNPRQPLAVGIICMYPGMIGNKPACLPCMVAWGEEMSKDMPAVPDVIVRHFHGSTDATPFMRDHVSFLDTVSYDDPTMKRHTGMVVDVHTYEGHDVLNAYSVMDHKTGYVHFVYAENVRVLALQDGHPMWEDSVYGSPCNSPFGECDGKFTIHTDGLIECMDCGYTPNGAEYLAREKNSRLSSRKQVAHTAEGIEVPRFPVSKRGTDQYNNIGRLCSLAGHADGRTWLIVSDMSHGWEHRFYGVRNIITGVRGMVSSDRMHNLY